MRKLYNIHAPKVKLNNKTKFIFILIIMYVFFSAILVTTTKDFFFIEAKKEQNSDPYVYDSHGQISDCLTHSNADNINCINLPIAYVGYGDGGYQEIPYRSVVLNNTIINNPDFTLSQIQDGAFLQLKTGDFFDTSTMFVTPSEEKTKVENFATITPVLKINQYGNPTVFGEPIVLKKQSTLDTESFTINSTLPKSYYILDLYKKIGNDITAIYETTLKVE